MTDVPRIPLGGMTDEEEAELDDLDEDENKDVRMSERQWEKHTRHEGEFEESDDEDLARANGGGPKLNGSKAGHEDHRDSDADGASGRVSPNGEATAEKEQAADSSSISVKTKDAAEPTAEVEEDASAEKPPPKVDADGDVGMDDSAEAEAPIKTEEPEAEKVEDATEPDAKKDDEKVAEEAAEPKTAAAELAAAEEKDGGEIEVKDAGDKMDVDTEDKPASTEEAQT